MLCTHWHNQPPPRHMRRVAVVCGEDDPANPGTGYFTLWSLRQICEADMFKVGDEPEGYDNYLYLVDYSGDIEVKHHPAYLWAIDLYEADWHFGVPKQHYLDLAPKFDRIYTAHKFGVQFYKEHGIEATHLPVGCYPELHHPCPEIKPECSWVAVCHRAGPRIELLDALNQAVPGGWMGYASGEAYSPNVAKGKCTINKSRLGELTMRVFENMAMGVPLVTDRVTELDEFFREDEHYLAYTEADELIEKVRWVQAHPEEAGAMAARAREIVLEHHTYYQRMLNIFIS